MKTANLLTRLEAYRRGTGLTKAELARAIGANSLQQYANWVYRGSMPKEYYDAALRILGQTGDMTKSQAELLGKIEMLNPSEKKVVLQLIDSLLDQPQGF